MFSSAYQCGFFSLLYSVGSKPLGIWAKQIQDGKIKRVVDEEIASYVLDVKGQNPATTFITCPSDLTKTLGIRLEFLVIVLKNMNTPFSIEIEILDDQKQKRRIRASTFHKETVVNPTSCIMPIELDPDWNQIQFNLADFTKRAYNTTYAETLRVTIHASCRLRRVYFADRLYNEAELPVEFQLPIVKAKKMRKNNKLVL